MNSVNGLSGIFQITETYSHPPTLDERLLRGKSLGTAVVLSESKAQESRPLVSISKYILKIRGWMEYVCYG